MGYGHMIGIRACKTRLTINQLTTAKFWEFSGTDAMHVNANLQRMKWICSKGKNGFNSYPTLCLPPLTLKYRLSLR